MRHTKRPVVDIITAIPELASLARETVRLHPRRGERLTHQSKIGGQFLWPADEEWPLCEEHQSPLVTVLQLTADDVPELGFPQGADLFQLLWCPNDHQTLHPIYAPASQAFWRKRSEVSQSLGRPPSPILAEEHYCPTPCVVHLERVTEYPSAFAMSDSLPELWSKIKTSEVLADAIKSIAEFDFDDPETLYQYWLSVADGTKVKGYPNWIQGPETPQCKCRAEMEYLLTVASAEFDGGTWGRWLAEEERHVWGASYEVRNAVQGAAGLMLGDMGNINFFICHKCDGWPIASVFQCS